MADTQRTQTDLLTTLFQDGQANGSITAQDIRDLIVSLSANQKLGWSFHHDGEFTASNKKVIAGGVKTLVTIDNAGTFTDTSQVPSGDQPLWDTTTNCLVPLHPLASFDFRLSFASDTAANNNFIELDVDIGGGVGVFYHETSVFVKGTGIENRFTFTFPAFVSQTFVDNTGSFFITPNGTANFWDFRLYIVHTYHPQE